MLDCATGPSVSQVNVVDFQSYGVVTLNSGSTATPTLLAATGGSTIYLNGGSRTYVGSAASPSPQSATLSGSVELNGGLLVNNGTINGTVDVNYGGLAKGAGTYGVVNVGVGGVFSPGNSPGVVTAANVTLTPTATTIGTPTLLMELAGTTPGTGYDQLHVTGQLSLGGYSARKFNSRPVRSGLGHKRLPRSWPKICLSHIDRRHQTFAGPQPFVVIADGQLARLNSP
jgi:hypothetical protein